MTIKFPDIPIPKRLKDMIILGIEKFQDPYCADSAAQITYFILLSLVPTVIIITQFLSLVHISASDIDQIIEKITNPVIGDLLKELLSTQLGTGNNLILAVTAIWAASKMQFAMQKIANYIYTNGETTGEFLRERVRSLLSMIVTMVIFTFITVIMVNGPAVFELVFGNLLKGTTIDMIWTLIRWPLTGFLYFLLVLYNYWTLPSYKLRTKRLTVRDVFPGSVFGAVGMLVVTIFYSMYIRFSNMGAIYGALASIVALLFWFYLISTVLIIGMLVNKVWAETAAEEEQA